ncbi:MAG: helix-turn-helix transcriptional regulator [Phycisphaerae bacterium]|nr:helix-turn-helix transcriptional regulator [Phycisphaerae bacterium]
MNLDRLHTSAHQASQLLKTVSNEYRLLVLCQLVEGEKQVAELQSLLDLSQSALSQHLARLRKDKLVTTRRESQAIFYSLASEEVRRIIEVLYELYCSPPTMPSKKKRR